MKNGLKTKLLIASDVIIFGVSTFLFLYYNPSGHIRKRLIYIAMQIVICSLILFLSRLLIGVYKHNFDEFNRTFSHIILKVLCSDVLAAVVMYVIQKFVLPDLIKLKFVQVACISGFNLLYAISSRTVFQALLDCSEEFCDRSDSYR